MGTYPLRLPSGFSLLLRDYYYVPAASRNLISVSCLAQDSHVLTFDKDCCSIYFRNKLVARGFMIDSLYHLHVDVSVNVSEQVVSAIESKRSKDEINQKYLWHLKLGHIGEDRMNKMEKDGLLGPVTSESYPVCESCLQEKMARLSFVGHGERTTEILTLVHTDVCGPFDVSARGRYSYFITFTDDYS